MRGSRFAVGATAFAVLLVVYSFTTIAPGASGLRTRPRTRPAEKYREELFTTAPDELEEAAHAVEAAPSLRDGPSLASEMSIRNESAGPNKITVVSTSAEPATARAARPYVVIGIATAPRNTGHREWIRSTWMTLPNVRSGAVHAQFLIGVLTPAGTVHAAVVRDALRREQSSTGDLLLLNARETKPPGEKMIAFFRWCVTAYGAGEPDGGGGAARGGAARGGTAFCVKTDDDAYVHTVRLEHNLRQLWAHGPTPSSPLAPAVALAAAAAAASTAAATAAVGGGAASGGAPAGPYLYAGATLWASYLPDTFEVCGHGMGPNMASGAARTERCAERGAVGPFPYVAGTLEVLSMPLASWIAAQPPVAAFVQRAHAATPPRWSIGEDTVLGMWVHSSPLPLTALHWGWDKIHDLCFQCKDKTQLWKPITPSSVVVHIKGHQASRANFEAVHANFSRVCGGAACLGATLPFDVSSLADLCSRNENIRRGYSKCALLE